MHADLDRLLATATMVLIGLAGWLVAGANDALATNSKVVIFFLADLIVVFDMLDLIGRVWLRRLHGASECGPSIDLGLPEISRTDRMMTLHPYAVVVSIHNAADDIDRFLSAMEPVKDRVWIIDDASSDDTLLRVRRSGWNCLPGRPNRNKPGAIQHLVRSLPVDIATIVVMDPDVGWDPAAGPMRETLERVIGDLQRSGAAALSPRFNARRRTWISECQALEYELACGLGRKSLGELGTNSGVSIYRRSALETALSRHSLSIYAEDLENSLLLLAAGERIYYDDRLIFTTEAKGNWSALFSQRVGWAFGGGKMFLERLPLLFAIGRRSPLGAYQYLIYLGFMGILCLPFKLFSIALLLMSGARALDDLFGSGLIASRPWNQPILFELWWVKSAAVLCVACVVAVPRGQRMRHLATIPFFGFYSLWQYVPMTIGLANVVSLRFLGRRLYADHYDRAPRLYEHLDERTVEAAAR